MSSSWKGKTRGGVFGYAFFIKLIKLFGITPAYVFLSLVAFHFIWFAPKATASTWRYFRRARNYGFFRSAIKVYVNYYKLGQILIDKIAIGAGMKDKYHFEFENYDEFLAQLNSGKGVIMIGAHIGNWEIGTPFFDDYGKKINIVMYDAEHEKIKELLEKNGSANNYKIIPVNKDNLQHVFTIADALNRNEYVCFQGDRFVNKEKLLQCEFMGREANFPAGPFLLSSRMKAPVVFYFAMREKHRTYRFKFTIANEVKRTKELKPEDAMLQQYVAVVEKTLDQYPEQWFNYYDFWSVK